MLSLPHKILRMMLRLFGNFISEHAFSFSIWIIYTIHFNRLNCNQITLLVVDGRMLSLATLHLWFIAMKIKRNFHRHRNGGLHSKSRLKYSLILYDVYCYELHHKLSEFFFFNLMPTKKILLKNFHLIRIFMFFGCVKEPLKYIYIYLASL